MQVKGDANWLDDRISVQKANLAYHERQIERVKALIAELEKQRMIRLAGLHQPPPPHEPVAPVEARPPKSP